jgi:hypothetical protein
MTVIIRHSIRTVIGLACLLALWCTPTSAQTYGVRIGASADPDQFFFGGHYESRPLFDRVRFRPNIEVGVGDHVTLAALNFEFAYHFANGRKPWNVYAGAGPALILADTERRDQDHAGGGFNFLLGIQHRQGLFGEIKIGAIDSPDFKFTVGYTFH